MTCILRLSATAASLVGAFAIASQSSAALIGRHVTLTNVSATGYSYEGTGTDGLPGTTDPDSRRRPKIYNDFAAFDASTVGSKLTMTYDILWNGANPTNESTDWRFGFVSTSANGGKGLSLGANFDIGILTGTDVYQFSTDTSVTSGVDGSGEMDSAFTATLNDPLDGVTDFASLPNLDGDPFSDRVSFNDITDTHRVTLMLERIVDGYSLSMTWTNLTDAPDETISHSTAITTSSVNGSIALAAGVTSWDRLGFFVNDDVNENGGGIPWNYTLSNVAVTGDANALSLGNRWLPNAYQVPEPGSLLLAVVGLLAGSTVALRRVRG